MSLKKMVVLLLIFSLLFVMSFSVSANPIDSKEPTFNSDTIITMENIDEILEYYGIDPSEKVEMPGRNMNIVVTVKDFEEILKKAQSQPKIIYQNSNGGNDMVNEDRNFGILSTGYGNKQVNRNVWIVADGIYVRYTGQGRFFQHSTYGRVWTEAFSYDVETLDNGNPLVDAQITRRWNMSSSVVNPYRHDAFFKGLHDYEVTSYYVWSGIGVPINKIRVQGQNTWGNSFL